MNRVQSENDTLKIKITSLEGQVSSFGGSSDDLKKCVQERQACLDDKRKYVDTIRSLEAENQKFSADSASVVRIRADLDALKSQFDNCQISNQGLEREIKNIASNERRTQDNLRKCQASLAGSVD